MKNTPFPHPCGRVLDINWITKTRVNYNCAVCGELMAWSDLNPEDFNLKVNIQIQETQPKKKIYPLPEEAEYNPLNCEMWK